jgi:hypothetical protein
MLLDFFDLRTFVFSEHTVALIRNNTVFPATVEEHAPTGIPLNIIQTLL